MPNFQVVSDYTPSGDQPEAIEALAQGSSWGWTSRRFWA